MNKRGLLIQTLIATLLWGLGMHFVFDMPRENLLSPMLAFAAIYWVVARLLYHFFAKGDGNDG